MEEGRRGERGESEGGLEIKERKRGRRKLKKEKLRRRSKEKGKERKEEIRKMA